MTFVRKLLIIGLSFIMFIASGCGSGQKTESTKRETAEMEDQSTVDLAEAALDEGDDARTTERAAADRIGTVPEVPVANPDTEPDSFSHFTAVDLNGDPYDASLLQGHRLNVINFWGTFCPPCLYELPFLGNLSRSYDPTDVQIVGVVVDAMVAADKYSSDVISSAKDIIAENEADFIHLLPSPDLQTAYMNNVTSIPLTVFVTESGEVVASYVGARDEAEWAEMIDEALADLS
ncbi:MAG TPA: TlpA family protein disulfide reductase [Clostridiaceae bacterium]|nr:TlpA family protein disulfide reductase [Clostridiaceae bacterium]